MGATFGTQPEPQSEATPMSLTLQHFVWAHALAAHKSLEGGASARFPAGVQQGGRGRAGASEAHCPRHVAEHDVRVQSPRVAGADVPVEALEHAAQLPAATLGQLASQPLLATPSA